MKLRLIPALFLLTSGLALAATEEHLQRKFDVASGGTLNVDVDLGSIVVETGTEGEVSMDIWRKTDRGGLTDYPLRFAQDGTTVSMRVERAFFSGWFNWFGGDRRRREATYTIRVPANFNLRLKTADGGISVAGATGQDAALPNGGRIFLRKL